MTNYDINSLAKNIGVELPKEDYRHPDVIKYAKRKITSVMLKKDGFYFRIDEFLHEEAEDSDWESFEELTIEEARKAYPEYIS